MHTLELLVAFGMPLSIFLLVGWKLVVRLRLEQQGSAAQAKVTSVRNWTDSLDGIKHQFLVRQQKLRTAQLVLVEQPDSEQQRVIGVHAAPDTGPQQRGEGWSSGSNTPSLALLVGHRSRQIPATAVRATSAGSSATRAPCRMRSACRRSTAAATLSGPSSSPAWGVERSPAGDKAAGGPA